MDNDGDGDLDGPPPPESNNNGNLQPAQAGTAATNTNPKSNSTNDGTSPGIQQADVDDTPDGDGDGPDGDGDGPDDNGRPNAAGQKSIPILATFAMVGDRLKVWSKGMKMIDEETACEDIENLWSCGNLTCWTE